MELEKLVYSYPTKYDIGFTDEEQQLLLKKFPNINMDKYNNAMMGNTCQMRGNKIISYHQDVYHALLCGLENRDLTIAEWD